MSVNLDNFQLRLGTLASNLHQNQITKDQANALFKEHESLWEAFQQLTQDQQFQQLTLEQQAGCRKIIRENSINIKDLKDHLGMDYEIDADDIEIIDCTNTYSSSAANEFGYDTLIPNQNSASAANRSSPSVANRSSPSAANQNSFSTWVSRAFKLIGPKNIAAGAVTAVARIFLGKACAGIIATGYLSYKLYRWMNPPQAN